MTHAASEWCGYRHRTDGGVAWWPTACDGPWFGLGLVERLVVAWARVCGLSHLSSVLL
jgi:hypothetical protein